MTVEIPQTQRAAVVTAFGKDHEIKDDVPVRQAAELRPGECLVKIDYAGVCHSDLHLKLGDWPTKPSLPKIGGHEGVGHVVAIGHDSPEDGVKVGDRVGLKWIAKTCTRCDACRKGKDASCPTHKTHGYSIDGVFAEYVVSYLDYVTPIPENLDSLSATAVLCAGMTVYKALKQTNTVTGDWVAIPGAGGGLGHLAVQYAVAMGLRVIAIDTGAAKKELSLANGAERWIDFVESGDDIIKHIKEATGGGPHAAVVTAGVAAPFNQAVLYLRPSGTLVAVGMPAGAFLHVPIIAIVARSIRIQGSAVGNRQDCIEALDIAARGKVHCASEVATLDDLNATFQKMQEGKLVGRVVLKF
ncbi:hypothetical protein PLICRDRAFT_610249 [Plicaturopsis crispa FD-325 SS-3]|nr:hypothetical protein PLICRDRAFT_610249 [Plicaturopsis crispa FD-325 SS-3]